jgi:hypothetical protein
VVVTIFKQCRICPRIRDLFLSSSIHNTRRPHSLVSLFDMAFRSSIALAALSARALVREYSDGGDSYQAMIN